jgi:hypothetical protein
MDRILVAKIDDDLSPSELLDLDDTFENEVRVDKYWSGDQAPSNRYFKVLCLWSDSGFHIRFAAAQDEPMVVSRNPNLNQKTIGLWERDVCEVFLAPDPNEPHRYFEFEVAPTGEWLDLAIDLTSGERVPDFDHASQMKAAASISDNCVRMAISVPWSAFGSIPSAGNVWLGNLFRCVGGGPERGYLAWRPTKTPKPNFHVPEAFGEFLFIG